MGHFALLDPDSESGSTDPIESGSDLDTDPDPQPCINHKKYSLCVQEGGALRAGGGADPRQADTAEGEQQEEGHQHRE